MTGSSCTVSVDNSLDELERIYAAFEAFIERCGLTAAARHALLLVTEELFANAVRYGYDEGARDTISLTVGLHQGDISLTIRDRARPFDVSKPPKTPGQNESLDDMDIGGLGLFLVHEFAQSITYDRDGTTNVTELVLKEPAA